MKPYCNMPETTDYEQVMTLLVSYAGDANALVYDALDAYAEGDLDKTYELLDQADKQLTTAHSYQFQLMSAEANSEDVHTSILLIHAMDICMNAANSIMYTKKLISVFESKK